MNTQIQRPIYLDHHSTTPVAPEVLKAMLPYFSEEFGNASSTTHSYGWIAKKAVDKARDQVANLIHAQAKEIIFTSGATESIVTVLWGLATQRGFKGHIITSTIEHKATLQTCEALEKLGIEVSYLTPNSYGQHSVEQIESAIRADTFLLSLSHANNEIGTIQPIHQLGEFLKSKNIFFHVDAAQSLGKIEIDLLHSTGVDFMSFSSHKLYGPKGVGALFIRKKSPRIRLSSLIPGAGQEQGLRGGTLNVAAIVGFGAACELSQDNLKQESARLEGLRNLLWERLNQSLPHTFILNGHPSERLPHNLNFAIEGIKAFHLFPLVHQRLAFSAGSSCSSESGEPSHVIKGLGFSDEHARSTIRLGLGRSNGQEDILMTAEILIEAVKKLKNML